MSGNLSLERGLGVMRKLGEAQGVLGVREIARHLDLSPPAVQRILNTLADHGYVEQDIATRRYRLGPALVSLTQHMLREDRLIRASQVELDTLAGEGCFNAFLGIRRGDQGIYLRVAQSRSPVVIRSSAGETFALHSTAMGKALLLDFDRDAIVAILGAGPFERLAPRTVTDIDRLNRQIQAARSTGYTTSLDENFAGLIAVGAPIRDARGTLVGAISVAYPKAVGPQVELPQVGEKIAAAVARISMRLGYRDDANPQGED
ncbi:IclR family transcriptional regulator [Labrys sp. La1]|uniref:IclR family transcriptional regulator n=1 Tax=Labrys sp. La1 TaxID=3404917 RepID=UPI003EBA6331